MREMTTPIKTSCQKESELPSGLVGVWGTFRFVSEDGGDFPGLGAADDVNPALLGAEHINPAGHLEGAEKFAKAAGVGEPGTEGMEGSAFFRVNVVKEIEGLDPLGRVQADDRRELVADSKCQPGRQEQDVAEKVPSDDLSVACRVESVHPFIHRRPDEEDKCCGQSRRLDPCGEAHKAFAEEDLLPVRDSECAEDPSHKKPVGDRPSDPCAEKAQQGCDHRMPVVRRNPPTESRVHR